MAAAAVPLVLLARDTVAGRLGANPVEALEHRTGDWALRLLLATLAVSPLRRLTRWNALARYRRTLGLTAFSYVALHFLIYVVIDQGFPIQGFAIRYVAADIAKRPYITVGFTAFCLLLPLAFTSTRDAIRRLGGARWNALHRLIYVAAALAALHYLWLVKGNQWTPVWYALGVVALLAARLAVPSVTPRRRAPDGPRAAGSPRPPRPAPAEDPS